MRTEIDSAIVVAHRNRAPTGWRAVHCARGRLTPRSAQDAWLARHVPLSRMIACRFPERVPRGDGAVGGLGAGAADAHEGAAARCSGDPTLRRRAAPRGGPL